MALETVTLTNEELARQDKVDNAVMDLIIRLAPADKRDSIDWDIEVIGEVRDELQWVLVNRLQLMTDKEFYPSLPDEGEDDPCGDYDDWDTEKDGTKSAYGVDVDEYSIEEDCIRVTLDDGESFIIRPDKLKKVFLNYVFTTAYDIVNDENVVVGIDPIWE